MCKHCALAIVRRSQKFCHFHRGGTAKINQMETVSTFTYKLSLVKIDVPNIELSW